MTSQLQYIALLRAINVGGHAIIKMADLPPLFESAGCTDVRTYIQTGNVIFKSAQADRQKLTRQLEERLELALGHRSQIFLLTPSELRAAVKHNPFHPERTDDQLCQLMFLSDQPDATHINALMALQGDEYRFQVHDRVFYFAYSKSAVGQRRQINFEKVLGIAGTARTWKVVNKLIELAAG